MVKPVVTADESQLREVLGMQARSARPALAIGQVLDDTYRIDGEIGAGGMGRVYRARDTKLGRDVAIKLHAVGGATSQRLVREAAALAKLAHPNVVTVHAVGEWAGHPWVAMEYVPGGTARDWISRATRSPDDIVALYADAALGLAAAHEVGLVHRDFKPDNVLVGRDHRPRVADFGLVRELRLDDDDAERQAATIPPADGPAVDLAVADTTPVRVVSIGDANTSIALSREGFIIGTPAYMAPEQWADAEVTPAADQYALALSLWEALTGARPFSGDGADELLEAMVRALPAPPAGKMPRHVERALRRALAFAPAQRWPSVATLVAALRPPPKRSRLVWMALGAGAALAGAAALVFALSRRSADDDCANEIGLPSQLDVALAAAHGRTARVDGDATARRIQNVADALRGEDRRLASGCSEDPALRAAARACRAHAGRVAAALFTHASSLPPSEAVPLVLEHPQLAACAPPWLAATPPAPEPVAWAIAELDAALVIAEHGGLATARAIAAAVAADPIASDATVARRLELARAAIAIVAAEPHPDIAPAATDDAATALIAARLTVADAALRRAPAAQRASIAAAMREVERLAKVAPEEAYRAAAAGVMALDAQERTEDTVAQYARLAPLTVAPPVAYEDATLAYLRSKQFQNADEARAASKQLVDRIIEHYGAAHPRVAAAQLRLGTTPVIRLDGSPEPPQVRVEALAKLAAADDGSLFVARVLGDHGNALVRDGKHAAAEPYLLAARRGFAATFGPDHLAVALVDLDRVLGLLDRRDVETAASLAERAVAIIERALGSEHALVAVALDNLAVAVRGRGDLAGAIAIWHRIIPITARHAGDSNEAASSHDRARIELARTHVMRGDWQIALDTLEPVVKALEAMHQHDQNQVVHLAVGSLQAGKAFLELKRYRNARVYLTRAKESFSRIVLDKPALVAEAEALLARIPVEAPVKDK